MDVDIVKAPNNNTNMDFMAMMMQMEKFPELFSDPFYKTDLLSSGSSSTTSGGVSTLFNDVTLPSVVNPTNKLSNVVQFLNMEDDDDGLFRQQGNSFFPYPSERKSSSSSSSSMAAMREMIFRIAVMQPVHIDPESVKPPKRRNVRISKDPQSVAARHRRERISERIRILQRLVPGGTKMDTASMLDEAIHYVKFLKKQVQTLEQVGANRSSHNNNNNNVVDGDGGGGSGGAVGFPLGMSSNYSNNNNNSNNINSVVNYSSLLMKGACQPCQVFGSSSKQLLS